MNDRNKLKQLAEQSGFLTFAGPDIHAPEDPYSNGCADVLAKFAELIIRECAEFTDPGMKPFLFKHFGVEE